MTTNSSLIKVLSISGSLRKISINTAALRALAALAPPSVHVRHFDNMAGLPLFNPDLEADLPASVRDFHQAIASADVLIIASPEYAHGITGAMKNALDWCVSFEGFVNKPVVLLQCRARSVYADTAIRETLTTMSANLLEQASTVLPITTACSTTEAMLATMDVRDALLGVIEGLSSTLNA